MRAGAEAYLREVRDRTFPTEANSATMDADLIARLRAERQDSSESGEG